MNTGIACSRCGRKEALSEERLARCRTNAAPLEFMPFPPGLCIRCALEDPVVRAELDAWHKRTGAKLREVIGDALARPLEWIDDFVAQFGK